MPGPREQELTHALSTAQPEDIEKAATTWADCRLILVNVARKLQTTSVPVAPGNAGELTAKSLNAAFAETAEAMLKRAEKLAEGRTALRNARDVIDKARADLASLGAETTLPPFTPPLDPKSPAGIKKVNERREAEAQHRAMAAERERVAQEAVARLDVVFGESAAVMRSIHGQPDPEQPPEYAGRPGGSGPGTSAPGGGTPVTVTVPSAQAGIGQVPGVGGLTPGTIGETPIGEPGTTGPGETGSGGNGGQVAAPAPSLGGVGGTGGIGGAAGGGGLSAGTVLGAGAAAGLGAGAVAAARGGLGSALGLAGRGGATPAGTAGAAGAAGRAAARPLGASSRTGTSGALGRGAGAAGATGRGAGAGAGRGAGAGAAGRGAGAAGRGAGATGRGAGAAGATGRRGKKDERRGERTAYEVNEDWLGDDESAPGVIQ